jgi:hypothetical protein
VNQSQANAIVSPAGASLSQQVEPPQKLNYDYQPASYSSQFQKSVEAHNAALLHSQQAAFDPTV